MLTKTLLSVSAAVLVATGLSACSGDDQPAATQTSSTPAPPIDVPKGVTLTGPGTTLEIGEAASAVYTATPKRISAISVRVTKIRKGNIVKDFKNFVVGDKQKTSTPYYVEAVVVNHGPAGLDKASVPLYGFDSTETAFPATTLVGDFEPCPNGVLPPTFGPKAKARTCSIFLVPKGQTLQSVELRTNPDVDPISWPAP